MPIRLARTGYMNHNCFGDVFRMPVCRVPSWGLRWPVSLGPGLRSLLMPPPLHEDEVMCIAQRSSAILLACGVLGSRIGSGAERLHCQCTPAKGRAASWSPHFEGQHSSNCSRGSQSHAKGPHPQRRKDRLAKPGLWGPGAGWPWASSPGLLE